jgi:2,3-bisphosphoglycerate-dependent phosphoglycerate mutase
MISKLFVFRHTETFDNKRGIFSGWRDSALTPEGLAQAKKIAEQLKHYPIEYAFTSHLKRARKTLEIVLAEHFPAKVFVDDRIIERCYGLLQGKSKERFAVEYPECFARIHGDYAGVPPQGESLKMVEKRVLTFLEQLNNWLGHNVANVAISCHGNSIRPIRRVFENLSVEQMLQLEHPQHNAIIYNIQSRDLQNEQPRDRLNEWEGVLVSGKVRLATDPLNSLKKYY